MIHKRRKYFTVSQPWIGSSLLGNVEEYHLRFSSDIVVGYESNTGRDYMTTIKKFLRKCLGLQGVGDDFNDEGYVYFHLEKGPDHEYHLGYILFLLTRYIEREMLYRVPKLMTLIKNRCRDPSFMSFSVTHHTYRLASAGLTLEQALADTKLILSFVRN